MAPKQRSSKSRPSNPKSKSPPPQIADPRFTSFASDPRFRLPSRKNTHVTLDKRFAHVLHDDRFLNRAKVDRYGRRIEHDKGRRELERFYRIQGEEDGNEEEEEEFNGDVTQELRRLKEGKKDGEESNVIDLSASSEDESSEDDTSTDESEEEKEEEVFGILNPGTTKGETQDGLQEGIPKGEVTKRLAVVNLDWDNIRAVDLMAVVSSFVPAQGRIDNITVYPSEFGRERIEREELEGPPAEIFGQSKARSNGEPAVTILSDEEEDDQDEDDDDNIKKAMIKEDSGQEFNSAKLRRYQLERLRYYYAIITCSSKAVAEAIYQAVDGTEYLASANFFDLRFVPDETDFSADRPRDSCDMLPSGYKPNEFVTSALQHSKVKLTWDADDGERQEVQKRAFRAGRKELEENDLKAYLGSDSSGSEDEAPFAPPVVVDSTTGTTDASAPVSGPTPTNQSKTSRKEAERQKMRSLLGLPTESEPRKSRDSPVEGDMQITFTSGLSSEKQGSVFENTPEQAHETTVEKYVRKERERKSRRKERLKTVRNGVDEPSQAAEDEASAPNDEVEDPQSKDLGFDDPFFTKPGDEAQQSASQKRKAERREKRRAREAEEAASVAQRAQLQRLMDDNDGNNEGETGPRIKHFDMRMLARAGKSRLKNKTNKATEIDAAGRKDKTKLSERDKEALDMKQSDTFRMDVSDERFRGVFDRAEFAIDPMHPRYVPTEGMQRMLEEVRQKRGRDVEDDGGIGKSDKKKTMKKKKKKKASNGRQDDDVSALVEKVRQKAAKATE